MVVIDPEYADILEKLGDQPKGAITDVMTIRNWSNSLATRSSQALPWPKGMQESTYSTTSLDGTTFDIHRFLPLSVQQDTKTGPHRAVIFVFGGGMISGSVEASGGFMAVLAQMSQTQVFAPQYRIAPENPYPAGIEDVYSTVEWLQSNAQRFNVDPARIIVFGQSAGGALAAGVALMARDKGLNPPLAGQCLRYPMLDDRTTVEESEPRVKYMTWTPQFNDMGWKNYLGGKEKWERPDGSIPYYAAPGRAGALHDLPPAHIGVSTLDLFKDEDMAYAARLAAADVGVDFHLYPGVPHGFDGPHGLEGFPAMKVGKELWENEANWIMRF
ncbi:Alpha/Beta hydrolase protein [Hypoxylon sp. FL0890]|nr:Alpha/Beta hydrolase protein [Hypoxylon sp. FL0890]